MRGSCLPSYLQHQFSNSSRFEKENAAHNPTEMGGDDFLAVEWGSSRRQDFLKKI